MRLLKDSLENPWPLLKASWSLFDKSFGRKTATYSNQSLRPHKIFLIAGVSQIHRCWKDVRSVPAWSRTLPARPRSNLETLPTRSAGAFMRNFKENCGCAEKSRLE